MIINPDKLSISFNQELFDYYIPHPKNPKFYITKVGNIRVGFGSKSILKRVLEQIKEKFPDGINDVFIEYRKIPSLQSDEPLIRRLNSVAKIKKINKNKAKIPGMFSTPVSKTSWEWTEGHHRNYENVYRPEERWWPIADIKMEANMIHYHDLPIMAEVEKKNLSNIEESFKEVSELFIQLKDAFQSLAQMQRELASSPLKLYSQDIDVSVAEPTEDVAESIIATVDQAIANLGFTQVDLETPEAFFNACQNIFDKIDELKKEENKYLPLLEIDLSKEVDQEFYKTIKQQAVSDAEVKAVLNRIQPRINLFKQKLPFIIKLINLLEYLLREIQDGRLPGKPLINEDMFVSALTRYKRILDSNVDEVMKGNITLTIALSKYRRYVLIPIIKLINSFVKLADNFKEIVFDKWSADKQKTWLEKFDGDFSEMHGQALSLAGTYRTHNQNVRRQLQVLGDASERSLNAIHNAEKFHLNFINEYIKTNVFWGYTQPARELILAFKNYLSKAKDAINFKNDMLNAFSALHKKGQIKAIITSHPTVKEFFEHGVEPYIKTTKTELQQFIQFLGPIGSYKMTVDMFNAMLYVLQQYTF